MDPQSEVQDSKPWTLKAKANTYTLKAKADYGSSKTRPWVWTLGVKAKASTLKAKASTLKAKANTTILWPQGLALAGLAWPVPARALRSSP